VVGWSISSRQHTELITAALRMALIRHLPSGVVVHHSDQACPYTSYDFVKACRDAGVNRSMGSVGDRYDRPWPESFFATLECELIDRTAFENDNQARMAVFDFIEAFYNPWRRHSSTGYPSPAEYERRWQTGQESCQAA
jgi:putative transposase